MTCMASSSTEDGRAGMVWQGRHRKAGGWGEWTHGVKSMGEVFLAFPLALSLALRLGLLMRKGWCMCCPGEVCIVKAGAGHARLQESKD